MRLEAGGRMERAILWGIICAAVAVRFWRLAHQLPDKVYIEEDEFIYTALKYGSGDLNPHWFFHPPLYSYILFALYAAYYLLGRAGGWFPGAGDFVLQYLVDPSAFYLIARGLSALLAIPAALLLHALGRRLYSPRAGLAAAAFYSAAPLAVLYSHYGCTEPLLIVLVLAVALCASRALLTGRGGGLVAAGAFAGAAVGVKYTGVFSFAILCAAVPRPRRPSSWAALLGAFAAGGIVFLAVCPFPLLSPGEFFSNIALLAKQPLRVGEYGWVKVSNLYTSFAVRYMPDGMGAALAWASLAGTAFLWLRHRREDILAAALPTAFYLVIGRSRLFYDRYMLICYPFFFLAAAALLDAAASRLRGRAGAPLFAAAAAALALAALAKSAGMVEALSVPDTALYASRWITANLPSGARILVDGSPIPQSEESIVREQRLKGESPRRGFAYREKTGLFFDLQRRAARGRKGFDVTRLLNPRAFHMEKGGKGYEEEWMTPEMMKARLEAFGDYDYILVSADGALRYRQRDMLPERFKFMNDFYAALPGKGTVLKVFSPASCRCRGTTFTLYRIADRAAPRPPE